MGLHMRHGRDTSGDRQRRRELEAQTRLRTHLAVTRVLAEAGSLTEATPEVLEAICGRLGWELGALWKVDADAGMLRCVGLWHMPDSPLVGFALATRERRVHAGRGTAGAGLGGARRPLGAGRAACGRDAPFGVGGA